jgi:hypothetical protein
MGVALMILLPLPIGWYVQPRLTAYVAYLAAFSFVFTFQSTMLITEWAGGSTKAFGAFPKANKADVWSYGVVNLAFLVIGLGLLTLTSVLSARRRTRAAEPVGARVAA